MIRRMMMDSDKSPGAALDTAADARMADIWNILFSEGGYEFANENYARVSWIMGDEIEITRETVAYWSAA